MWKEITIIRKIIIALICIILTGCAHEEEKKHSQETSCIEEVAGETKNSTDNATSWNSADEKSITESNDAEDVLDTYGLMGSSTMENPIPIQNSKNAEVDLPEETIKTKQSCTEHRMKVVRTSIQEEYCFYNYVTDSLECEMCGYRESCDHRSVKLVDETIVTEEEGILAEKVNLLRSSEGLSPLWVDSEWNLWAERRAQEISINYGHLGWTSAIENTYTLAENIAAGQPSGSDFFYAFCNSSQHRSAMLKENAVGIAVGIYIGANGTPYCAMVLVAER